MAVSGHAGASWLNAGAAASLAIALLHLAMIPVGEAAYAFFTAPSWMIDAARRGSFLPALVTLGVAGVFALFAACARWGAREAGRPGLRVLLVGIGGIYTLRGAVIVPEAVLVWHAGFPLRALAFSSIALVIGVVHLVGTGRSWARLGRIDTAPRRA